MNKNKLITISGKRKTSIAKARIIEGNGNITINNIPHTLLSHIHKLLIEEPLMISKKYLKDFKFDIIIKVSGGGRESQIEAARLVIAKALVSLTKSPLLKKELEQYDRHLLVADVRRKEACKPGDSKARAKRQTSYR